MRNRLFGTVRFFNVADPAGGGAVAAPVVVDPAAAAAAPAAAAPAESPAGAAPAAAGTSSSPPADGGEGPAAGEPAKPNAHAEPTLLEGAKIEEPKPAEAKPDEPAAAAAEPAKPGEEPAKPAEAAAAPKPGEEAKPVEPAAPVEYKFTLPDGITIKDEQLAPAIEVLREAGVKPELAQKLMDQHVGAMRDLQAHVAEEQQRVWQDTRSQWRKDVMADEQIGGAGHQTAMQAIARMRDTLVHPNDLPAFNEFLRVTGAGDHPMFLKLLHNASRYLDEPAPAVVNGAPPPDAGKKPGRQGLRGIYKDNEDARRGA